MIARLPAISFGLAGLAGLILFAAYCKLHALATGVGLPWTAPVFWGVAAGVPAGCLAVMLWRYRDRGIGRTHGLARGACIFGTALAWGVLVRGIVGPGRIPDVRELAAQMFAVLPVAAVLACAATLVMVWHSKRQASANPSWIDLPEEPLLRLRADQVSWISAAGNYCEFHSGERVHLVRVPLARMEERLQGQGFRRIHRSALVNVESLLCIEPSGSSSRPVARLRCGTTVPVGRRFQADALEAASCRSSHA